MDGSGRPRKNNESGPTPADKGRKRGAHVCNEGTNPAKKTRGQEEATAENKRSEGTIKDCEKSYGDHIGMAKAISGEKFACQEDQNISDSSTPTSQTPRDNIIKIPTAGVTANTNQAKTLKFQEESTLSPDVEEICEVYLCTRPVGSVGLPLGSSYGSQTSPQASSPSIVGRIAESWTPAQHWCAAFYYGGDKVLVCEATQVNKALVAGWKLMDEKKFWEHNQMLINFDKLNIPMERVKKTVGESATDLPYDITENNCQTWAIRFLHKLNITTSVLEHKTAKFVRKVASNIWNCITS